MKHLPLLRKLIAAVFFIGLTLMLLDVTGGPLAEKGVLHPYLGWMAKLQFFPAWMACTVSSLIIVACILLVTVLIGRMYCSIICPLGIMQDLLSWFAGLKFMKRFGKHFGKNRFRFEKEHKVLRYSVLALFAILCLFPATAVFAHLIAPYSAFGKMVQALVSPYTITMYCIIGGLFLIISAMACLAGREWCNTICPVGTFLGIFSRHPFLPLQVDESKCNHCGKCERNCKARCINSKEGTIDTSRCVDCMECIAACPQQSIHFGKAPKKADKVQHETTDTSRRQFLGALGALTITGIAQAQQKTDGGLAIIEKKQIPARETPLHPAGSQSHKRFMTNCTTCQLCVSACPNEVLRPSSDLSTFMLPEMQFDKGYCPPTCHKCADVCPAGAIALADASEKSSIQIGHAVWLKTNCVMERDGVQCGNCVRHCPTGALTMVEHDGKQAIAVDTERCIGCGHCEYVCPSRPFSAIYVEGHQVHRTI